MTALLFALALVASPESVREAELRAAKALALWEAKAYEPAAIYFLEAFELSGEPTQLRNAAKAYEAGGAIENARAVWFRFLALDGISDRDREEAEDRLAELAGAKPPVEVERAPIVVAPIELAPAPAIVVEAPPPIEEPIRWEPWLLSASGAVAAAVGGVLVFRAQRDLRALEERLAMRENGKVIGISFDDAKREEDRIEAWRFGSGAIIGVGIAAVIAGLSWWWLE